MVGLFDWYRGSLSFRYLTLVFTARMEVALIGWKGSVGKGVLWGAGGEQQVHLNVLLGYIKGCGRTGVDWNILMLEMDQMFSKGLKGETDVWRERNERVYHLPSCVSIDCGLLMSSGGLRSRKGAGE